MGKIYLIHLDRPFQEKVSHYIGYTDREVEQRLQDHKNGRGARLLNAVNKAKISYIVVRIWEDVDKYFERKLKKQKNSKRFCPVCNPQKYIRRGLNGS